MFEQQSLLLAHTSLVSLHDDAGTSQTPALQLSEQQSVLTLHGWWKLRQVAQLTPTKQVEPPQQPLVHDVASHTHAPATQCCPATQATPLPHLQAPPVQLSASVASQAAHEFPELPHWVMLSAVMQVLPEQQPLMQVEAQPAQTPEVQLSPAAQATHVEPPVPHWELLVVVTQVVPLQQPVAHEVESHTQLPPTQCCPAPQAGPAPQVQLPAVHESDVIALHVVHARPPAPHAAADATL